MRKLDYILESIRDEYMINVLEEGSVTELESLKTKKFLNESIQSVRGILIQEGVMDSVKGNLANNWKKYAAGAGTAAMMASDPAQDAIQNIAQGLPDAVSGDNSIGTDVGNVAGLVGGSVDGGISRGIDAATQTVQAIPGQAQQAYAAADQALGGNLPGGVNPIQAAQIASRQAARGE